MKSIFKKRKGVLSKIDRNKSYGLTEAAGLLAEVSTVRFDPSVRLDVRLELDLKKTSQSVRGTVTLPHGTGKKTRILVLCTPDREQEAKEAGADFFGLDEYIEKIKKGWTDVDVIIAQPALMSKMGALGKILGPRGLMPNPKAGTVTNEIGKAVSEVKKGKIEFKADKQGIIHATIGKMSFGGEKIAENVLELMHSIIKSKPAAAKGTFIKSIFISSDMSPSIRLDARSFAN